MISRRAFLKAALLSSGAILISSYPVFIERTMVRINHYRIKVPMLPPAFQGFRIVHLSDLHLGFLVSPSFIQGVIKRANAIRKDAIVCTGDYVHERNTRHEIEKVWPLMMQLKAKYGVFTVLGNHDHWADTEYSLEWLERSGQGVRHRAKTIEKGEDRLIIGGTGDYWEDRLLIDETFSHTEERDCRILLAHNPDTVDTEYKTPLSLVLCGHTHGGQVRLPFYGPPILPVKNKRYSSGVIKTEKTTLFISRGIGWAIYPVRVNCFPEIAVLKLMAGEKRV